MAQALEMDHRRYGRDDRQPPHHAHCPHSGPAADPGRCGGFHHHFCDEAGVPVPDRPNLPGDM